MSDQSIFPTLGISASAMDAQSYRMRVIAGNLANADTTKDVNGNVYRRRDVVFAEQLNRTLGGRRGPQNEAANGVRIDRTVVDQSSLQRAYRPGHPDADPEGYVTLPNVNPMEEMVDMMVATRAYEANVAAIKSAKTMALKALEIGK